MGTCAPGGALRAGELGILTAVWCYLRCSVRIARRTGAGIDWPCRNPTGGQLPYGSTSDSWQLGVSVTAFAVLGELERFRVGRGHGRRRSTGIACHRGPVDTTCAHRPVRALPLLCL